MQSLEDKKKKYLKVNISNGKSQLIVPLVLSYICILFSINSFSVSSFYIRHGFSSYLSLKYYSLRAYLAEILLSGSTYRTFFNSLCKAFGAASLFISAYMYSLSSVKIRIYETETPSKSFFPDSKRYARQPKLYISHFYVYKLLFKT